MVSQARLVLDRGLVAHPASPPRAVKAVEVDIHMTDGDEMLLTYRVYGAVPAVPAWASPNRADDLWKTTCFEIFIRPDGGDAYFEFNFAPSSEWAAYIFSSHRQGRRDLALSVDPFIEQVAPEGGSAYTIEVDLDLSEVANTSTRIGLSAVIEEADGTISYWALAHPDGKPDFHDSACFTLTI